MCMQGVSNAGGREARVGGSAHGQQETGDTEIKTRSECSAMKQEGAELKMTTQNAEVGKSFF
ncbi:hypothetical protein PF005_g20038 [Phytophthora fragariae]|uniref:Uncharacterized protein n=1 Tax=Phytophthora fragariae TaxID=53985 RepID=A0A6A3YCV4_9STRA|nr:hypothetical protein PF003_g6641 [Phytophthora fragariae]KAE8934593.1 hypothetical protein PF009_g15440 [Phytophthora fragariae]KAE8993069.1 hypothetical protein PF011_g17284 [Phytophthora fragariae]KAE9090902.1 hypothetical protein PF010_g18409 [Phytophthora fragariae]KAE9102529.1 hypothetical protein PF007_g14730 [Phytophthora fragariae]